MNTPLVQNFLAGICMRHNSACFQLQDDPFFFIPERKLRVQFEDLFARKLTILSDIY